MPRDVRSRSPRASEWRWHWQTDGQVWWKSCFRATRDWLARCNESNQTTTTAEKPPSSSSTSSKYQQNVKETTSPRSISPSVDPWSTESIADYDVVHPVIRYNKARRTCAKMLVLAGRRCRCHFRLIAECPSRHRVTPAPCPTVFSRKGKDRPNVGLCVCEPP